MDIDESVLAQVKDEKDAISEVIIDNIKTEIVKEEPWEADFVKCEICSENSDNETKCVHLQNDIIPHHSQDSKLQAPSLQSGVYLQTNSSNEDVKLKVEKAECTPAPEQDDPIIKLIDTVVTVDEEDYLDSPDYLSTNMDFVECRTGQIKTEDIDISCEDVKTESVKEEPSDNEASMSSDIVGQDEDNSEDVMPGSSRESQEDCGTELYRPKRVDETNKATLQCQVCSKSFSTRSRRKQHEITHTDKALKCKFCPRTFPYISKLTTHERVHTKEKPFQCVDCSASFATNCHLVAHERTHTGERPFVCKVCSKSFSFRTSLIDHKKIHTGEKPFQCKVCSKRFIQNSNLARHEKVHTGEKPFRCKSCSKSFIQRTALMDHERTHTGEKPFSCTFCSKPFYSKSSVRQHAKSHTGNSVSRDDVVTK